MFHTLSAADHPHRKTNGFLLNLLWLFPSYPECVVCLIYDSGICCYTYYFFFYHQGHNLTHTPIKSSHRPNRAEARCCCRGVNPEHSKKSSGSFPDASCKLVRSAGMCGRTWQQCFVLFFSKWCLILESGRRS